MSFLYNHLLSKDKFLEVEILCYIFEAYNINCHNVSPLSLLPSTLNLAIKCAHEYGILFLIVHLQIQNSEVYNEKFPFNLCPLATKFPSPKFEKNFQIYPKHRIFT